MHYLLLLLLIFSSLSAEECALHLTIEECVCRAKAAGVSSAEAEIRGAVGAKNETRAQFLPQITLEGIVDNNSRSVSGDLTQFQDFKHNAALGVSIKQGLLDFGSSWRMLRASRLRIDAAKLHKEYALLSLEEQVRTTYLQIWEKECQSILLESSVKTVEQELQSMKGLAKEGLAKQTDVLSLEVRLADEKRKFLQMRYEACHLRMVLNNLIGLPLFQVVTFEFIEKELPTYNADELIEYALEHRPDLLQLQKQADALRQQRLANNWSIAPRFYAFFNGNFTSEKETAISTGIGMNMPLYAGGEREAKGQQLRAEIDKLKAAIGDLKDELEIEIRRVLLQLENYQQALSIDEQTICLTQEHLDNIKKLHQQGYQSMNDIIKAEEQLFKAKVSSISNLYKSYMLCAHLMTITGGYQ